MAAEETGTPPGTADGGAKSAAGIVTCQARFVRVDPHRH
jgi:hypothetical protein